MPSIDIATIDDPTPAQPILASWGDAVRDELHYQAATKPRCFLLKSAAQEIATSTVTTVTFNTELYDIGGMHSLVSNTGRITCPASEGGAYNINVNLSWEANASGVRDAKFWLNGVDSQNGSRVTATTTGICAQSFGIVGYPLDAGDYCEIKVEQNSGGPLDLFAWFQAMWMAT